MVTRTKKIFVGGLSANTVVEDVKQYFEQYGKVRRISFVRILYRGFTITNKSIFMEKKDPVHPHPSENLYYLCE